MKIFYLTSTIKYQLAMKKSLVLMLFTNLLITASVLGQDIVKQKEAGVMFSNFDNFGLTYRVGTSDALWRFSAFSLSAGSTDSDNDQTTTTKNFGLSFSIGREYRKQIEEKFQFRYGLDVSSGFYMYETKNEASDYTNSYDDLSFGVNGIIGLNYELSEKVIIGIEILPGIGYSTRDQVVDQAGDETKTEYKSWSVGFSNQSARLSLVYRW